MHTGWKSRGVGTWCFFAKIPMGVKAFRKNCQWGSPYFGFNCIFINKCFEICLRGVLYLPSPLPPPVSNYGFREAIGFYLSIDEHFKETVDDQKGKIIQQVKYFKLQSIKTMFRLYMEIIS